MLTRPLNEAEQQGLAFADGLSIAELRTLDTAAILERAGSSGARFAPVVDGYIIPDDPTTKIANRREAPIPLIIGSNAREGFGVVAADQLEAEVTIAFGANAGMALQYYGIGDGAGGTADLVLGSPAQQFSTDSTLRCGNALMASKSAASGAPTWQYQFEQFVPGKEELGAAHSFEVPYVFGNLSATGFSAANYGPDDRRLSDLMTSYWSNFAKRGDPNGPGLPAWPQYTISEKEYLRLSAALPNDAQASRDLGGAICPLFPSAND
jgi:para-nitrobenzyl esterase